MPENNNMVSSDAEQIKKMASAIRDMSNDMKTFNSEMNATVKLISRMQSQVKSTSKTASTESKKRTREEMSDEQRLEQWRYKMAYQQRREAEEAAKAAKRYKGLKGLAYRGSNALKSIGFDKAGGLLEGFGNTIAKLGTKLTIGFAALSFIVKKINKEYKRQEQHIKNLNQQYGEITGSHTGAGFTEGLGGRISAERAAQVAKENYDRVKTANNMFAWLTDGLKKAKTALSDWIAGLSNAKMVLEAIRDEMLLTLSQSGVGTGTAAETLVTAHEIALQRMKELYPDRSEVNLVSDELYTKIANSVIAAITGGGGVTNTGYTTEGWEGWAFENLGWNPNVDYSDAAQSDARRRYLEMLSGLSDDDRAEQIKYYKNQSRLLKSIAGQLFSFDEVESQQAISMEDTVDATNMYGEDITEKLRNQEELLDELAKKYGLSYEQVQNIRKILTDTGLSLSDIELLLAAGISFDDDSTATIIDMATSFGLTAEEIIKAYSMYDNDLSKAAEELRKMAEKGIDVHVYLHDKEGGLQTDSDTTAIEVPSATGSGSENYYENLLEEMTDEELKERDPAGWERKHAFESLTGGGTHPAGKELPSFYSPKFATGGIGTSKITDATLFENGPEAVIPLTTDIGKQFMADAIQTAIGDTNIGGDTINVKIDGPVFTESERQLNKWATEFGDRYAQIKARRGGK